MSVGREPFLPVWLRGNFLLFGAVALALVVFVGTLAFILGRPGRRDEAQPPRNVFQNLSVELRDRGTVDLQTKSLTVTLRFPGLPEETARSMTVKVSLDGEEAQVSESGGGNEFQASALLKDKVENLIRSNGIGAVLLVKGTCEYGGSVASFDASSTRLHVVSKTEKELELAFNDIPEPQLKTVQRAKPKPTPEPPTPSPTPYQTPQSVKRPPPPSSTPYPAPKATPMPKPPSDPKPQSDAMKRFREALKNKPEH